MFLKLRRLKGYLSIESEPDIAFSVGYQSKAMSKIRDKSVRVPPLFISILYSVVWALKNYGQLDRDFSRTDFLLLVGSANQEKTVTPILKALKKKRSRVTLLCFSGRNYVSGCILKFGLTDVILALLLILVRRKNLNQLTSSKLTCYQFKRDYKRLLEVYFFLALFDRIIPNKSGVVLVSNDHTAMCRAFCLVAGRKGWKTAYVQHASVTSWFPQLTFDTAFLDGEASLLEYKASSVNPRHAFVSTDVVLVGMQSEPFQEWDADRLIKVGLALNKLFELERVIQLIKALSRHSDFTIVVRLHPSMSVSEISNELVAVGANVELHSASAVPINAFLKDIMFLIAGDSSIHLETLLTGIPSYYHQFDKSLKDYYGFVKNGAVPDLPNPLPDDLSELLCISLTQFQALKKYSASFGSAWMNLESEIIAEGLIAMLEQRDGVASLKEQYLGLCLVQEDGNDG